MEVIVNPFSQIKEIINKEIDSQIFPLSKLIAQYQSLGKEKWKDLELTTYFLDTVVDVLELKLKYFFSKPSVKLEEKEEKFVISAGKWRELKRYLENQEEKGIKIFWRNRKKAFVLNENEKINITQVYFSWLKAKEYKQPLFNYQRETYSIEEKMKEILNFIKERISFSEIVKNSSKLEIIYYFLALCELVNQGKIKVYQKDFLDEIILEKNLEYAGV
ncbi:MAG: segregation/condensation protein A [Dictyoglomaceae bacterium]